MIKNIFSTPKENDHFLQGDVLKISSNTGSEFFQNEIAAIIITADCDIHNGKHGDFYTLLPIITAENYLESVWSHKKISSKSSEVLKEITKDINKNISIDNNMSQLNPLQVNELSSWLSESSLNEILEN